MTETGTIKAWHYRTREPVRISWEGGRITELSSIDQAQENTWVGPSLFDLQNNGYGGIDFQQDHLTVDELLTATRKLREAGCRRFLLTLITDEWSRLTARLRQLRGLRGQSLELQSAIVGWHVEGPFLSDQPGFHGAHDPALMCDPTPEHILQLRTIAGDDPVLLTIAPERRGAMAAIELARSRGISISLGHTNVPADLLRRAVNAGATAFTHLGNGCPRELDRHDNILWRVFEQPGLAVSLIPDKIHVSPPLFRLMHRALPADAVFYISDAMSAAGMPPGRYKLGKMELEVGADQVVRQPGKPLFAGSALRPLDGVSRAAEMLGCPWQEAWHRFSTVPAAVVGLRNELAVGEPADFCVITLCGRNEIESVQ